MRCKTCSSILRPWLGRLKSLCKTNKFLVRWEPGTKLTDNTSCYQMARLWWSLPTEELTTIFSTTIVPRVSLSPLIHISWKVPLYPRSQCRSQHASWEMTWLLKHKSIAKAASSQERSCSKSHRVPMEKTTRSLNLVASTPSSKPFGLENGKAFGRFKEVFSPEKSRSDATISKWVTFTSIWISNLTAYKPSLSLLLRILLPPSRKLRTSTSCSSTICTQTCKKIWWKEWEELFQSPDKCLIGIRLKT